MHFWRWCRFVFGANSARHRGTSGTIEGVVKDQTGGVVPSATVEIKDPVSGYQRTMTTGGDGAFRFTNVPFNTYHMAVTATGFANYTQDVDVRSAVPVNVPINLKVERRERERNGGSERRRSGGKRVRRLTPTWIAHCSTSYRSRARRPRSVRWSRCSTPGVAADSNGLFHGLGDHASNSFSVDGQPITDQQSKVFSNQIPLDSMQSLEVISGAPPAEFGGKTSLVIVATTRSGMGVTQPHGQVTTSYGSFGTANAGFDLAYGGDKWGNFISANGLNTARFLDGPEFGVMHDQGNEENIFDRVDYKLSSVGHPQPQFRLQPVLVPDAEFVRRAKWQTEWTFNSATPICPARTNSFLRGPGTKRPAGRTAGSAFEDRNVQHRARRGRA